MRIVNSFFPRGDFIGRLRFYGHFSGSLMFHFYDMLGKFIFLLVTVEKSQQTKTESAISDNSNLKFHFLFV